MCRAPSSWGSVLPGGLLQEHRAVQQGHPPSMMRHSVADVLHPPHAGSVGGGVAGPGSGGCHQNLPQAVEPVGCRRAAGTRWHSATRGPCVSQAPPRPTAPACFCWPTRLPVTVGFARGCASSSHRVGSSLWRSRGGFASVAVASRSARLSESELSHFGRFVFAWLRARLASVVSWSVRMGLPSIDLVRLSFPSGVWFDLLRSFG